MPERDRGIELELHQLLDALEAVAEQEPGPLDRAEQVAEHREAAAADAREEQRRPAGGIDAPLNLGDFEPRVDLGIDPHQLAMPLEIVDALAQGSVAHGANFLTG